MKEKFLKFTSTTVLFATLSACGGGGGGTAGNSEQGTDSSTSNAQTTRVVTIEASYEIPPDFRYTSPLFDADRLIFAGGAKGDISGASHFGHPAFSDQIHLLNLASGNQKSLAITARSSHNFGQLVANGIGSSARIQKIASNRYLVTGGFQYQINAFDIDVDTGTVSTVNTSTVMHTDATGLNTTPYHPDLQGSAVLPNGNVVFFGYYNGLYAMNQLVEYVAESKTFRDHPAKMTMAKHNVDAYPMKDGRVLLVGGWDNSAAVNADSATRRAEIFNPTDNSITRVANFPEPISQGQHTGIAPSNPSQICASNYTYTIASNSWEQGCKVSSDQPQAPRLNSANPIESQLSTSTFIGRMSNGNYVYLDNKDIRTLSFSDDCSCYPFTGTTKVRVVSIREK
jgi:hypothetical protein